MRITSTVTAGLLVGLLAVAGCDLSELRESEPTAVAVPAEVPLTFAYAGVNAPGLIDQTLSITNASEVAKAPVLVIVPLDADGGELSDVVVQTAFGSDAGRVVAPADTVVLDVLRFKGKDADAVVDVRVDVTDEGTLADDVPPANDLVVDRFDRQGKASDGRTASLEVANTYDAPITVRIVGIEYGFTEADASAQFHRLTELAGPVTIAAGDTYRLDVDKPFSRRYFAFVRAYLTP